MKWDRFTSYLGIFLLLTISVVLLSISCTDAQQRVGSVQLVIDSQSRLNSRTILPDGTNPMDVVSMLINGVGPGEKTFELSSSNINQVVIDNLLIGNWSFTVTALNDEGNALAIGEITTFVREQNNTVSVDLDTLVGEGTLSLALSWNPEQTSENLELLVTITDETDDEMILEPNDFTNVNKIAGSATFEKTLAAGYYTISILIKEQDEIISGCTDTVRIIDETTSNGTIVLVIGAVVDGFKFTITDSTLMPIDGTITCTPEEPVSGEGFSITFEPTLYDGITEDDISCQWYCDGQKIIDGTSLSLETITKGGSYRYDIIVSHADGQSIGSKSITVSAPTEIGVIIEEQ